MNIREIEQNGIKIAALSAIMERIYFSCPMKIRLVKN